MPNITKLYAKINIYYDSFYYEIKYFTGKQPGEWTLSRAIVRLPLSDDAPDLEKIVAKQGPKAYDYHIDPSHDKKVFV